MVKIGVLGLQGATMEHARMLEAAKAEAIIIKRPEQLTEVDGLVMPGGESTTMARLMQQYGFFAPLQQFAESGYPIFGTCAGMILLAEKIAGQETAHLGLMNMTVKRNGFGRQRESFEADLLIHGIDGAFTGVFIRAPYILEAGENVDILSKYEEQIVAARQGQVLTCSFHPELADDARLHGFFVHMVQESKKRA